MEQRLYTLLSEAFSPTFLEILNESENHAEHASSPQTGESHFCIRLAAPSLEGLSRVEAQRAIYAVLGPCWNQGLHALRIEWVKM